MSDEDEDDNHPLPARDSSRTTTSRHSSNDENDDDENDDHVCCCLCYCGVDFSDTKDLPKQEWYDANNEMVFCDTCHRPYHQQCHFVPLLTLPRGEWHCLICSTSTSITSNNTNNKNTNKNNKKKNNKKKNNHKSHDNNKNNNRVVVYPFPPVKKITSQQEQEQQTIQWEYEMAPTKIQAWMKELTRFQKSIGQQLSNIRLYHDTLRAHTTTSSTRRHHGGGAIQHFSLSSSQQVMDTVWKLSTSKLRIRTWLLSLHSTITTLNLSMVQKVHTYCKTQHPSLLSTCFPYHDYDNLIPRIEPRCGNNQDSTNNNSSATTATTPPTTPMTTDLIPFNQQVVECLPLTNNTNTNNTEEKEDNNDEDNDDNDDDDLITLDDLQCCICWNGDATDENDLILCDGIGCFRAYHFQCVFPKPISMTQMEVQEDWFCPLCVTMAQLLEHVQSEYTTTNQWGYDNDDTNNDNDDDDDDNTIQSWQCATDVFPEAEHEVEMAQKWKDGEFSDELVQFVSNLLGMNVTHDKSNTTTTSNSNDEQPAGVDCDDDDEEDEDFDLEAFERQKRSPVAVDTTDDNASVTSSVDSLHDLSSVDIKIDRHELDALSVASNDDASNSSSSGCDGNNGKRRLRPRTRRQTNSRTTTSAENSSSDDESSNKPDVGTLDEANIVGGRRRRTQVDYRKLNDSMFGDVSETEAANLLDDGDEEFQLNLGSDRKRGRSSSSSDSSRSSDDDEESSDSDKDDAPSNESGSGDEPLAKARRSNARSSRKKVKDDESSSDAGRSPKGGNRTRQRSKKKEATTRPAAASRNGTKRLSANQKRKRSGTKNSSAPGPSSANDVSLMSKKATVTRSGTTRIEGNGRTRRIQTSKKVAAKRNSEDDQSSSSSEMMSHLKEGTRSNKRPVKTTATTGNGRKLVNGIKNGQSKRGGRRTSKRTKTNSK